MDIDDNEEEAGCIHVNVADQPPMIDVTHDTLNRPEGMIDMRCVIHCQHNAGDNHDDQ